MVHLHSWQVFAESATGLYRKRDCPGGDYFFPGKAEACSCGSGRFVPADPKLTAVPIEDREIVDDEIVRALRAHGHPINAFKPQLRTRGVKSLCQLVLVWMGVRSRKDPAQAFATQGAGKGCELGRTNFGSGLGDQTQNARETP